MAKRGVNKVILVGNLGQDPEVRYMPNGNAAANISMATSESWKDKATGQPQERSEWHKVVFFGKLAEIVGEYVRKGSKIYIEGALRTRKWQDKDGADRYSTEIVADEMQMLDSRQGAESGQQASSQGGYGQQPPAQQAPAQMGYQQAPAQQAPQHQRQAPAQNGYQQPPPQNGAPPANAFDDDIPF